MSISDKKPVLVKKVMPIGASTSTASADSHGKACKPLRRRPVENGHHNHNHHNFSKRKFNRFTYLNLILNLLNDKCG